MIGTAGSRGNPKLVLVEGCRHALEISIPVEEVENETGRVINDIQKKARLPGFRPGKAPTNLIRRQFEGSIREQVLNNLLPKRLKEEFEREDLHVVGTPDITDVQFNEGEPLRFKAEFEVVPQLELKDYKGLSVAYHDPDVTDEDVEKRIEEIRIQKADYANVDPRPIEDGDFAVLSLESISGVEGEPVKQDEMMLQIGSPETMEGFSENLRGMSPDEEKEFELTYPEDYGETKLAGKTVGFRARVKGIRKRELPDLNEEFAQDLGDYRTLEELRQAIRRSLFAQRQYEAQQEAKNKLVDSVVDAHDFVVPETLIERQIQTRVEQRLRSLAAEGVDPKSIRLDWEKVKASQREQAMREVKASLLLSKIAERESIEPLRDEVDREVERIARQQREPVAAVRLRFEKDGTLGRIASNIQVDKTINFLFEHARKTA